MRPECRCFCGTSVEATTGKKPSSSKVRSFVTRDFGANAAADEARSATENRDRHFSRGGRFIREQDLFRSAALLPQRMKLHAIELRILRGKILVDVAGKGEIHVVAAQKNVFADRDTLQLKFAVFVGDRDQREVGGAAADVEDQDEIARLHAFAPIGVTLEPGVKGGLRFFEKSHFRKAGQLRGTLG